MPFTPLEILRKYWQFNAFRPGQELIIDAVLKGSDTLALLPTGGGKSICYQVPALLKEGVCLVISPLIALMNDQVRSLRARDIPALTIQSGMGFGEIKKTLNNALHGNYKFLYVSPERLHSSLFREYLPDLDINLVAVDEAHCISQWGYDFRPSYLNIADLREELPDVPFLALTASATPRVLEDIADKLKLKSPSVFRQGFTRPNLSYSVFSVDQKLPKLVNILTSVPGSAIVYCRSRKACEEIAEHLVKRQIAADFYHARVSAPERKKRQEAWMTGKVRVMVCTNAFGMGIDKADVRTVTHYHAPDCLENYYQEAGRAGRDGARAYAVLLVNEEEKQYLKSMVCKRFPDIADIKKVYQALADYLQIPVGAGEGVYYDLDINTFVRNFQLEFQMVASVLRVLEQEGHLIFYSNLSLPTQIRFELPPEILHDFEHTYPQWQPLIEYLLRNCEGITTGFVSLEEKKAGSTLHLALDKLQQQLHQLQSLGVIRYRPAKESSQIHFLLNRAPAEFLHIDRDYYFIRRNEYSLRIDKMIEYLTARETCRSRFIAAYFGDTDARDCGICDYCLQKKF